MKRFLACWFSACAALVLSTAALGALPDGAQTVLPSTFSPDGATQVNSSGDTEANSWSNTNFTITSTSKLTTQPSPVSKRVAVTSVAPAGAYMENTSNGTGHVFTLTVTAKSSVLASFRLSSITLNGYQSTSSFTAVQVSATLVGGGTITNTAQSFSGMADFSPNLSTGSFSTSSDITSFTITFQNADGSTNNADLTFKAFSVTGAKPPAPSASTAAASSIAATTATLGGTATADAGNATITARGVVWSTTNTTPTIGGSGVTNVSIGSGTGSFSQSVTGLPANTLVYFRAYATNAGGTGYGNVLSFTTTTDADATVVAGTGVSEPVDLPTTATSAGAAVNLFDFRINDGGTSDGLATNISQVAVATSGTGPFSKVTWLLNGPDASNVTGTYSAVTNRITFSGLSISVANGSNETYTVRGYYNDNTGLTENQTFVLSVTGGNTSFTVGTGTQMAGSQSAVTNGTGAKVAVTATKLLFATQPAGSVSGSALTTQPVVRATDAANNIDADFTGNVTLTVGSGGGTLSGTVTRAAASGVATFTNVAYNATADQQAFTLATTNGASLTNATSNGVTSDVVATTLEFSTQPAPTNLPSGTATPFTTVPVVRAVNGSGVVDTAARSIALTLTNTSGGSPAGTVNALGGVSGDTDASGTAVAIPASSGVATFTGLSVTYTNDTNATNALALRAASSGLTAVLSSTLTSYLKPSITSTLTASGTYNSALTTYTITASNSPTGYSASGLPTGLSVNTSNGEITGTPTQTGSFNVTIGATNQGGTGTATLVLTIAKANATVTLGSLSQQYNRTPRAASATTSPVGLTVTFTYNGSSTAPTAAGDYAVIGTISDTNYEGSANNTLTITKAGLTLTGANASDKTYDGNSGATITSYGTLTGVISGDTVNIVTTSASAAFPDKNVGTDRTVTVAGVTLSGADSANYTLTQPTTTADITAATLTVTAENKTRVYGVANPTLTYTLTGFVGGDTQGSATTGSPSITTTATAASTPGTYAITAAVGTLAASNYTFSTANGTLTITAVTINDWREANFTPSELADVNISGPNADPDSDGVTNLYEYAFGTDPKDNTSGPNNLVYTGTFAGGGTLTETGKPIRRTETSPVSSTRVLFVRRTPALTSDLVYTPQFTANGTTWFNSASAPTVLAEDDQYQIVSVPWPNLVGGRATRSFRVEVSIQP